MVAVHRNLAYLNIAQNFLPVFFACLVDLFICLLVKLERADLFVINTNIINLIIFSCIAGNILTLLRIIIRKPRSWFPFLGKLHLLCFLLHSCTLINFYFFSLCILRTGWVLFFVQRDFREFFHVIQIWVACLTVWVNIARQTVDNSRAFGVFQMVIVKAFQIRMVFHCPI